MLNELMNFPKIREIINKDLSKDQIRELESVNLQSFLQQGLEIFSICKLFEKFIG